MSPSTISIENAAEQSDSYRNQLDAILDQGLSPENIDTYANEALEKLIFLAERASNDYSHSPTVSFETGRDIETASFQYFGLEDIEMVLDHVADKSDEIQRLDMVIAGSREANHTIVPTDASFAPRIIYGPEEFREKQTIQRLKTVLFVLSNQFNINVENPNELILTHGSMENTMMRKASYYLIESTLLDKAVLVCNEEGNATYIVDIKSLHSLNITTDEVSHLAKTELNQLLREQPQLGQRIVYSFNYVSRLIDGLHGIRASAKPDKTTQRDDAGKFLRPNAPDKYKSLEHLSNEFGVDRKTISKALTKVTAELGPVTKFKFRRGVAEGFSPSQQEILKGYLESRRLFSPKAPEGLLSISGIARHLGLNYYTVVEATQSLGETLGVTEQLKFGSRITAAYSASQQESILNELQESGAFDRMAPEGYLPMSRLAKNLKVGRDTLVAAIEVLEVEIGEVSRHQFHKRMARSYSPNQQEIIKAYLETKDRRGGNVPEGYLVRAKMAKQLGISNKALLDAIATLSEELPAVGLYKVGSATVPGYSPAQQELIITRLEQRGLFTPKATEGIRSANVFSKDLGISRMAIETVINELGHTLGPIYQYRFRTVVAAGYSPAQQELIHGRLQSKGYLD